MTYNFDEIIDRSGTSSMKWEKYKGTDIIPMWVADMDFKVPPPVLKAVSRTVEHGIYGYTVVPDSLNETIVEMIAGLYDWKIEKKWIVWTPGVVSALNVCCAISGKPGDKIISTVPVYPPFLSAPSHQGRVLSMVPLKETKSRSTLDFELLEKEFQDSKSCLFMFCSPYNPGGTVFSRDEIETLVRICVENDILICSDEIHSDFVLNDRQKHIPTASISKEARKSTITLMAPSKTYNIPGLGCAFAIIPDPDLRNRFKARSKDLIPEVNLIGLAAAQAAYRDCGDWLTQLIRYLRKNRDMVYERVNRMPGCRMKPVDATYLAWIDVRETGINDPAAFFEQAGVGLSDGKFFGRSGFVRLNFGCPESVLEEGLKRMESALRKVTV